MVGLGKMGILLNRGSSSTPSSHLGAPGSATGTSSSSAENNHMDHNTPNHSTRSPGPSQQTPRQLFHYPNPHNLTAETVAALPPPGQSGPSTFTFSPGSRYLSFLSSTHGNISPSPSFHHGQNMSPAPNSRLRSMSNVGMVNTNGERRLCCIDMDKNNGYNQNVHGQVFSLLDSSTLEISETGDSQLSLEERLRRERQRLHATGVTQFSWSTVSPSPHDIKNVNNNAATGEKGLSNVSIYKGSQFNIKGTVQTSTSSRGTTEVLLHDPDSDEREGIEGTKVEEPRMKNDVNMSYDNNNKNMDEDENLRILIPLRGNIYVQDGIGAPLRLIYDKNTSLNNVFLSNPNSESNGNTTKQNRRNSGSAIGRDNGAIDPQLSPDGTMVAFVVAGEIYVIDASSHPKQQTKISSDLNGNCTDKPSSARVPVRITFGASNIGDDNDPHHSCITHGLADFVAQEEMDRYRGFWWNPTSDGIVFTKVDETDVPPYRINHQGRDGTGSSTYEDHRYPFAGEQNPKVSLGFISVDRQIIVNEDAQQAKKSWVHDVKWLDSPSMADEYLARVCFLPDGCVCAQWQNRAQDTLVMVRTDVYTGESSILLTETTHVWINLHHMLRILPAPISPYPNLKNTLPKGSFSFLFASERSGYSHLYLYTYIGGSKKEAILIRAVSAGKWVVENIVGVNMNKNLVYVTGTFDSPLERHLYSLPIVDVDDNKNKSTDIENSSASRLRIKAVFDSLTGNIDSSPIPPPKPTRLTIDRGMHSVVMDKYCKYVVDTSSDLRRPSSVKVFAVEDTLKLLFVLHDVAGHDDKAGSAIGNSYAPPELISFKTSDDTEELHAAVYLPDPKIHGPGPYPLIASVYGGPHVQRVNRSWSQSADMRAQRLRSLGFAVVKCDNRGSSRRGVAFESCIHQRLGRLEVLDQVTAVRQLVQRGIADPSRVGIYGWSYGGYLSAMCLFRAPDVFSVAVAGAPVTSWDGYDTHYTERYMGTPQNNPDGYREAALFEHVGNMRGQLMIVHGLIDENVHFRHTARLINRLIAAGKAYDLLMFPDERHSPRRLRDRVYMEQRISDFFVKSLGTRERRMSVGDGGNMMRPMAGHL